MTDPFADKSTVAEIRDRFDHDVERFSNLDTGQVAAKGSAEAMALVADAAVATTPALLQPGPHLCDIGCGAGNYTLRLLQRISAAGGDPSSASITLIDLSQPMLDRATQRLIDAGIPDASIRAIQSDIRDVSLGVQRFDAILAAQCFHHLRAEAEWRNVFSHAVAALCSHGSLWISDSIDHATPGVRQMIRDRWSAYLESVDGPAYRDRVMAYVDREDTPRPLAWQLDLLREVGLSTVDVLTVDNRFAAFGGGVSRNSP
ncbi:MAG: class I SAM-dependent methyltransferase [Planctomycetota bacterium]